MATNYRRGRSAEAKAAEELRAEGYLVIRSAASQSPVDLVAIGLQGVRLIQVKRGASVYRWRGNQLNEVRAELAAIPAPPGVTVEIWVEAKVSGRWQWVVKEVVTHASITGS